MCSSAFSKEGQKKPTFLRRAVRLPLQWLSWPRRGQIGQGHSSRHAEAEPSRPNPYQGSAMKLNRAFCFFPNHSQPPTATAIDNKLWCRWISLKEKAAWRVPVESEEEQAHRFSPWGQGGGRLEICMSVETVFSISGLNASPGPCWLPLWVTVWAVPRTGLGLLASSGHPYECTHFIPAKTGTLLSRTRGNLHWCHDGLKTNKAKQPKIPLWDTFVLWGQKSLRSKTESHARTACSVNWTRQLWLG